MTTTGAKVFVDTNVLLRSRFVDLPLHRNAVKLILDQQQNDSELWISRQVIREFMVQVTRPQFLAEPLTAEQIEAQWVDLQALFRIADDIEPVTTQLLALLKEYPTAGKQIHDANIVATMLVYGVDTLLTQNLDDMKRFTSKINIIPLTV